MTGTDLNCRGRPLMGNQLVERKEPHETLDVSAPLEQDFPPEQRRLGQVVLDTLDRLVPCRVQPQSFGSPLESPVLDI